MGEAPGGGELSSGLFPSRQRENQREAALSPHSVLTGSAELSRCSRTVLSSGKQIWLGFTSWPGFSRFS